MSQMRLLLLSIDLFSKNKIFLAFFNNLKPIQHKKAKYEEIEKQKASLEEIIQVPKFVYIFQRLTK